jgi:hypothetical protein
MLMTSCQRAQDTLVNAVLTSRPVLSPQAVHPKDKQKEKTTEELIDYQFFVEQPGESKLQDLADSFINEGTTVCFVPWVREKRWIEEVKTFEAPPPEIDETTHFTQLLQSTYPDYFPIQRKTEDPYTWDLIPQPTYDKTEDATAEFAYDEQDRLVLVKKCLELIHDGPVPIPKNLEDVIVPSRCENVQIPGPSNPRGAHHVFLRDYPNLDEIRRLKRQGYYDLLSSENMDKLDAMNTGGDAIRTTNDPEAQQIQRDALAGLQHGDGEVAKQYFERLIAFVPLDVDGDGLDEQVVVWYLPEQKMLLRARYLSEVNPSFPPSRPLAKDCMIPVPGEFYGIGMLELLEHLHDLVKILLDQSIDKQTLNNMPAGFYRVASGLRPEVIRLQPGMLHPTANPETDIFYPQLPNADQAMALNLMALIGQWEERASMIGELNYGRVPQGKASALRNTGTMQALLQQGDARPERVLRRFFSLLSQVWQCIHSLNQAYLQPGKVYRVSNPKQGENPYRELKDQEQVRGVFQFEFKATLLNTNKAMLSQVLQQLSAALVNPLTLQTGMLTPDKLYNLLEDLTKSLGQDITRYLNTPPNAGQPEVDLNTALGMIVNGQMPMGRPIPSAQMQLQQLQEWSQLGDERLLLIQVTPPLQALLQAYTQQLQIVAQQEMQMQQMMQATQQFSETMGQQAGGGGPGIQDPSMGPVGQNELRDESLPGAGGGANPQGNRGMPV